MRQAKVELGIVPPDTEVIHAMHVTIAMFSRDPESAFMTHVRFIRAVNHFDAPIISDN